MNPSYGRYYKLSEYYRRMSVGKKVHKVTVDAGFSCPNRDGTLSFDGCVYCDNRTFSLNTRTPLRPVQVQIREGIERLKMRFGAEKFVVYFQAYSNTYAPVEVLRKSYDTVRSFKDVIGISVATRPDCVSDEVVRLLAGYAHTYDVWIEYGLQSIHNKTLERINRGHTYEDFLKALHLTRKCGLLKTCAHLILGLPGETKEMMFETARALGTLMLEGVKIHPLHVIRQTALEEEFLNGTYAPLARNEYIDLACGFLEYLWPGTVIHRIGADCPQELLVAPTWILDKNRLLEAIDKRLCEKNSRQGKEYTGKNQKEALTHTLH
ncbi:MAG: TIGR01212 family radical SAM protein [Candidatus Omnitrophota bacterium]